MSAPKKAGKTLIAAFIAAEFITGCEINLPTAPAAPTGVSVGSATETSLLVSWRASADASGYRLWRSATLDGGYSRVGGDIASATSYSDGGLSSGSTMWYRVSAFNSAGESPMSAPPASGTTLVPPPEAPAGLSVGSPTAASLTLGWTATTGAISYSVYRAGAESGSYSLLRAGLAAAAWTDNGLESGATYWYKVTAWTSGGESAMSAAASGTTSVPAEAPAVPTGLAASGILSDALTLRWDAMPNATGYRVYRSADGATFAKIGADIGGGATTSLVSGLAAAMAAQYAVAAYNAAGESARCAAISATTLPAPVLAARWTFDAAGSLAEEKVSGSNLPANVLGGASFAANGRAAGDGALVLDGTETATATDRGIKAPGYVFSGSASCNNDRAVSLWFDLAFDDADAATWFAANPTATYRRFCLVSKVSPDGSSSNGRSYEWSLEVEVYPDPNSAGAYLDKILLFSRTYPSTGPISGALNGSTDWNITPASAVAGTPAATAQLAAGWNHVALVTPPAGKTGIDYLPSPESAPIVIYLNGEEYARSEPLQKTTTGDTRYSTLINYVGTKTEGTPVIGAKQLYAGTGSHRTFLGMIDDVRMYATALTADEVAALHDGRY